MAMSVANSFAYLGSLGNRITLKIGPIHCVNAQGTKAPTALITVTCILIDEKVLTFTVFY
jgi:hypothetical protein